MLACEGNKSSLVSPDTFGFIHMQSLFFMAQVRSIEVGAAVDENRLAVDIRAVIRKQEGNHRSNLFRSAETW